MTGRISPLIDHGCWKGAVVFGALMFLPDKVGDEYEGYDDYDGDCDEFSDEPEGTHDDEWLTSGKEGY